MRKILLLASAAALSFLATSCADYATYGFGTVGAPVRGFGNPGFVGGGLAPLKVGFVATSFDRWAWDPWRRHYFDRSCGRYWNPVVRNYCAVAPRRFASPIYPTGFRRGQRLACPSFLPRTPVVVNRGRSNVVPTCDRYAPVIHGQSRGVASVRPSSYSTANRSRGVVNTRSSGYTTPTRPSSSRSNSYRSSSYATPTRRTSSPSTQRSSGSSRYQTVSSTPSRTRSTPVVRSSSYTPRTSTSRSSYTRSSTPSYTPRSSSSSSRGSYSSGSASRSTSTRSTPSRSTSSPSRSISRSRQRTR